MTRVIKGKNARDQDSRNAGMEAILEKIGKEWVIIDMEGIQTSCDHMCARKVGIGRKDGITYYEFEARPCKAFEDLQLKYKKAFWWCKRHIH